MQELIKLAAAMILKKASSPYGLDLESYIKMYENFDEAHRPDHMESVVDSARMLSDKYAPSRKELAELAAILHDVGISKGREEHENYGGEIVSQDETIKNTLSPRDFRILINAIREHRATTGKPTSIIGKIVSDADRMAGKPTGRALNRAMSFRKHYFPEMDEETALRDGLAHLAKKYAKDGPGRRTYYPETAQVLNEIYDPIIDMHESGDINRAKEILAQYLSS